MTDEGSVRIACSSAEDASRAMGEVLAQLQTSSLAGAFLFCSSRYDLERIAAAAARLDGGLQLVGCTTAGEITPAGATSGAIAAIGFPAAAFTLRTVVFHDLDNFDPVAAQRSVIAALSEANAKPPPSGGQVHQAAILLIDGLSRREELIAHTLQHILGDIPLVGGSAGDDMTFQGAHLLHGGAFHADAAVLAILSATRPLEVFRAGRHAPRAALAVVTRADAAARRVYELNGEPAAAEYARLVDVDETSLGPEVFAAHPLMVRVGGEYFVRAILKAEGDRSLTFGSAIERGLVLRPGGASQPDALADVLEATAARLGGLDAVLLFDDVLNQVEARTHRTNALATLYGRHRACGFNTYGEQFRDIHVNQNVVGLAIARSAP